MSADPVIAAVQREFDDFALEDVAKDDDALDNHCEAAIAFRRWADTALEEHLRTHRDIVGINQAVLMLITRYFSWRECLGRSHRNQIGERGHRCIFHVLEATYHRLRRMELALSPPMLFLPPPSPPRPPRPQSAGIFIGEDESEM
jgi:hypothetical protein